MSRLRLTGLVVFLAYAGLVFTAMMRMAADSFFLADPAGIGFFLFALSPVAFAAWRLTHDLRWLYVLLPVIGFGLWGIYDMAFVSTSSTAAIGWFVLPIYQWAGVAVGGLLLWLVSRGR